MNPGLQPTTPQLDPQKLAAMAASVGLVPPQPPPATPASAGFAAWASDPRNSSTVANSIVKANQPIIPPNAPAVGMDAQTSTTHSPADPQVMLPSSAMAPNPAAAGTTAPLPTFDQWSTAHPDQLAHNRLQEHPILGTLVGALTGAAGGAHGNPTAGVDWAAREISQGQNVPSVNQERYKASVLAPAQAQAAIDQKAATAADLATRSTDRRAAISQRAKAAHDKIYAEVKKSGQKIITKTDPDTGEDYEDIVDDRESAAFQDRENLRNYRDAVAEKAAITTEIAKNRYVPGTPEYKEAQRKLAQTDAKIGIAAGGLGLRRAEYNMHATGTGPDGRTELPGILHTDEGQSVGSNFQKNVTPTTTERDAAGRADTMVDLGNRIRQQLADPEVAAYLGPMRGRVSELEGHAGVLPPKISALQNDLVSYGAFQAGLHPVRGIGALHYFDKVMGGLGQTPEQLLGKLNSNDETAADVQRVGTMPTTEGQRRMSTAPNGPRKPSPRAVLPPAGSVIEYKRGADGKLHAVSGGK